jgi:hypothetical protein
MRSRYKLFITNDFNWIQITHQYDWGLFDPFDGTLTIFKAFQVLVPPANARSAARAITGPSAIGSENGTEFNHIYTRLDHLITKELLPVDEGHQP